MVALFGTLLDLFKGGNFFFYFFVVYVCLSVFFLSTITAHFFGRNTTAWLFLYVPCCGWTAMWSIWVFCFPLISVIRSAPRFRSFCMNSFIIRRTLRSFSMLIVGTFTMLPVVNWLLFVLDDGDSFVLFPWMWECVVAVFKAIKNHEYWFLPSKRSETPVAMSTMNNDGKCRILIIKQQIHSVFDWSAAQYFAN